MAVTILKRFMFRRGAAADWTTANPVLLEGEPGLETDTGHLKFGDGVTAWNALDYFTGYLTAAQVLALLLTVDGSGSALDADLLDGQHGPYYLSRANHTGTQDWSTITGEPTTLAGYGIVDAQPLDSDLTTIAGLTATTDNFLVAASSAWASRTPAQARTSLALGTAALVNTGTSGATIPLLNAGNTWSATQAFAALTGTNLTLTGAIQLNNGQYIYAKNAGGSATRVFGMNASDQVFYGSIDQAPSAIIFSGAGTWASLTSSVFNITAAAYQIGGTNVITSARHIQLRSYTVGTLPSASPAGQEIYVSNETGGAVPAFSDGTNWRRVTDRTIVA
jgi:hypothetical protein